MQKVAEIAKLQLIFPSALLDAEYSLAARMQKCCILVVGLTH